MTNDNWGIGYADDFKYNYAKVQLFKGFIKISAEGGTITVICHFSTVILLFKPYLGFVDSPKTPPLSTAEFFNQILFLKTISLRLFFEHLTCLCLFEKLINIFGSFAEIERNYNNCDKCKYECGEKRINSCVINHSSASAKEHFP